MPALAAGNDGIFSDRLVRERIGQFPDITGAEKLVYVPMAADVIHPGHIRIIQTASRYGRVMVGLFTDEAIMEYKKPPLMGYEQRKAVVGQIKGVDEVVPQASRDYAPNLQRHKPACMVHGTDWKTGPLAEMRQKAIDLMATWGGEVIEPEYTQGVSSSELKSRMHGC
jgi:phosphoenolpyruvate phosphomutase